MNQLINKISIPVWLPVSLLVAGAFLRLGGLSVGALWYDEAYSLTLASQYNNPVEMVGVAGLDFNPPLWELTVWPFVQLLGRTAFVLRLPALLAGWISLWLAWQLTTRLVDPGGKYLIRRVVAAALVGLLPIGFWTAQDGRVYGLVTAFYLGQLFFATERRWWGFMACTGLLMYAHNVGVFYALAALGALLPVLYQ